MISAWGFAFYYPSLPHPSFPLKSWGICKNTHVGKPFGIFGKSFCFPTLITRPCPSMRCQRIWQWNNHHPEILKCELTPGVQTLQCSKSRQRFTLILWCKNYDCIVVPCLVLLRGWQFTWIMSFESYDSVSSPGNLNCVHQWCIF